MRIVFTLVAIAAAVGPVSAQPAATIAFGGGVSHRIDAGFDGCDDCAPLAREFGGELALFATDTLAVFAGGELNLFSLDKSFGGTAFNAEGGPFRANAGLRFYGPPGPARLFGEVGVGFGSERRRVTAASESFSFGYYSVLDIAPGVGADIAVNDRTAVRISGSWIIGRVDGQTSRGVGVGAGLVFAVGGGRGE
jgi:hypothetical protein